MRKNQNFLRKDRSGIVGFEIWLDYASIRLIQTVLLQFAGPATKDEQSGGCYVDEAVMARRIAHLMAIIQASRHPG